MEEVRQITDLLEDAEKSVSIIKNVFKIQGESPCFTISPNEAGQFILDDVLAFISKYNIKNNIDDEDLKEAAKDDNHCAVGWIDKTGEDFKSVLEDLFIKLPAECRQGVTARFIRRAEGILSSLKEDSDCTIALLAFVKYGEKERFYMTPSNESFSIDELMNLCISLLTVAYQMLYFLGLRQGECCALTWKDINFKNETVNINKTITTKIKGEKWTISTPKTKSSIRILPLTKNLLNDLKTMYNDAKQYTDFKKDWFVFGNIEPFKETTIQKKKNTYCKMAGVKQIRIHDFRHSCASLLINKGASISLVSKYLGHSDITTTLNIYTHMYQSELENMTKILDNL